MWVVAVLNIGVSLELFYYLKNIKRKSAVFLVRIVKFLPFFVGNYA